MQLKVLTSIDDGKRVWNFGELLPVSDQAEADRLISLGAAELYVERQPGPRVISSLTIKHPSHVGIGTGSACAEVAVAPPAQGAPEEDEVSQSEIDALVSAEAEAAGEAHVPVVETLPSGGAPVVVEPNLFSSLGLTDEIAAILVRSGFDSMEKLRLATVQQLVALPKIGYARARKIVTALAKG